MIKSEYCVLLATCLSRERAHIPLIPVVSCKSTYIVTMPDMSYHFSVTLGIIVRSIHLRPSMVCSFGPQNCLDFSIRGANSHDRFCFSSPTVQDLNPPKSLGATWGPILFPSARKSVSGNSEKGECALLLLWRLHREDELCVRGGCHDRKKLCGNCHCCLRTTQPSSLVAGSSVAGCASARSRLLMHGGAARLASRLVASIWILPVLHSSSSTALLCVLVFPILTHCC
jgi:hypothetical protein